ncbi:uncharacterized protein BDZ99DRAFT_458445 [Mytilinidion resinicola]|uniref:ABM domain-containing protein n=1 Tax=Mytilinidion resinicola TaxID=574789 RepID=A0A6A6Z661_9PEZI|nr:uncharacterized protein BDZ99DRAFT_458445 [Mytilinidion resinicola]KAF2816591.1 hypothetical protein BDZ99DRAFT_458445 [Mytilinidion resinicola]
MIQSPQRHMPLPSKFRKANVEGKAGYKERGPTSGGRGVYKSCRATTLHRAYPCYTQLPSYPNVYWKPIAANMISVLGYFVPTDGKDDYLRNELQALVKLVKENEPDCLIFELLYDDDIEQFVIHSMFKDRTALNFHLKQPYLTAFKEGTRAESFESMDLKIHERIDGFSR